MIFELHVSSPQMWSPSPSGVQVNEKIDGPRWRSVAFEWGGDLTNSCQHLAVRWGCELWSVADLSKGVIWLQWHPVLAWVKAGRFDMCCVMRALKSLDRVRWGQEEKKQDEIGGVYDMLNMMVWLKWIIFTLVVKGQILLCKWLIYKIIDNEISWYVDVYKCLFYTISLKYARGGSTLFRTLPPLPHLLFFYSVLSTLEERPSGHGFFRAELSGLFQGDWDKSRV